MHVSIKIVLMILAISCGFYVIRQPNLGPFEMGMTLFALWMTVRIGYEIFRKEVPK